VRSRHGAPAGRPATVPPLTQNLGARQSARLAADPSRRGFLCRNGAEHVDRLIPKLFVTYSPQEGNRRDPVHQSL
jgi:hypothetical protein